MRKRILPSRDATTRARTIVEAVKYSIIIVEFIGEGLTFLEPITKRIL